MRRMFNCREKFSTSEDPQVTAEEEHEDNEDSVLCASDCSSSGSVLAATDDEEHQGDILYASDEEAGQKRSYAKRQGGSLFLGKPVCLRALTSLLGLGEGTVQRVRAGVKVFSRMPVPKHPVFGFRMDGNAAVKWKGVVLFLWQVYQSAAELMPTDMRKATASQEHPFPSDKRDPDFEIRHVSRFTQTLATYSSDIDVHMIGPGTFAGACRYLQASSRTELFWEYVASSRAKCEEPASYSTFLRVANTILKPGLRFGHLKFRGVNQHGQCNQCYELKTKIKLAKTPEARDEHYRLFSHRLLSQWLDRQQYWNFRTLSHQWFQNSVELGNR